MARTSLHIHTQLSRAYLALARFSCLYLWVLSQYFVIMPSGLYLQSERRYGQQSTLCPIKNIAVFLQASCIFLSNILSISCAVQFISLPQF